MIDRSLNYGRHLIKEFLSSSIPYSRVLDIGAGGGDDLLIAKTINSKAELYALECYEPLINTLENNKINVSKVNIENEPYPFENGFFDVIIANQILEHTKEIYWIFHEISRLLPVGGKLIIGVPNLASLHNRLLLAIGEHPTPIQTNSAHIRGFTKSGLMQFLESCFPGGYQLDAFKGSNFYPFPPEVARLLAHTIPSMAWSIFLLLEKRRDYTNEFIEYPINMKLETNFYLG